MIATLTVFQIWAAAAIQQRHICYLCTLRLQGEDEAKDFVGRWPHWQGQLRTSKSFQN